MILSFPTQSVELGSPLMDSATNKQTVLVVVALFLGTLLIYWPVHRHEFINFDDTLYVTANPHVQAGLTMDGLRWAFGNITGEGTYWHPLTWLSHMLDCQLFGLKASAHHLANALWHAVNVLLLFTVLRQMTGALWRSALVAALFSCHPLQVDSVAWVAERKNVLSTFFWMLTLLAYTRYAQRPGVRRYLPVLGLFALGLMTKPMLVTLPLVMLLLDFWPLRRLCLHRGDVPGTAAGSRAGAGAVMARLALEKLPLFALAAASSVITFVAHERLSVLHSVGTYPLDARLANALVSYARYIGKTVWPSNLAFFYPHPGSWPAAQVLGAGLLIIVISMLAVRWAIQHPYLIVGWFWFLGTLVPVIGLIQASDQAMADRFVYVPVIGLFIAAVWGLKDLAARWPNQRRILVAATVLALGIGAVLTSIQLQYWRNSETLFRRALAVTKGNYVAHNNLGNVLDRSGRYEEAKQHYLEALRFRPRYAEAQYNLANVLFREGNILQAVEHYSVSIRVKPDYTDAHFNLGVALVRLGRIAEAERHYREVIRFRPAFVEAHHNLGALLVQKKQLDEAILHLSEAVRLRPGFGHARNDLGIALAIQGRTAEAETQFAELVRLEPGNANARYNLANALADQGKVKEAALEYSEVLRLNPQDQKAREKLDKLRGSPTSPP